MGDYIWLFIFINIIKTHAIPMEVEEVANDTAVVFNHCNGDDCSPNWLPFDNMNAALRGYNLMEGNPLSDKGDPGFRHQIFIPTVKNEQHRYELRGEYTFNEGSYCDTKMKVEAFSNLKDYRNFIKKGSSTGVDFQIGTDIELTVGKEGKAQAKTTIPPIFQAAWGKSNDFAKMESVFTKKRGTVAVSYAVCLTKEIKTSLRKPPPFLEPFKEAIKDLNQASDGDKRTQKKAFRRFIRDYGTHVLSETAFGAEIVHRTAFSNSVRRKFNKEKIKNCEFNKGARIFGIPIQNDNNKCSSSDNQDLYGNSNSVLEASTMTKGSRPERDLYKWGKQNFIPVPLKYKLVPIVNLFKQKIFDGHLDQKVSAKKIVDWFVPMYFEYCESMYGKKCPSRTGCGIDEECRGCGYDDRCPADTTCIGTGTNHRCSEWSSWECISTCSYQKEKRERSCTGCSGSTYEERAANHCKKPNSCYPEEVLCDGESWGTWYTVESCPPNQYVTSFYTKVYPFKFPPVDNTGLSAIYMRCSDNSIIHSGTNEWGDFGAESSKCNQGFFASDLRVVKDQGIKDDFGTVAIELQCSGNNNWYKSAELNVGSWRPIQTCKTGYKIAGLRTQVQSHQGGGSDFLAFFGNMKNDDTALNGVCIVCRYFG